MDLDLEVLFEPSPLVRLRPVRLEDGSAPKQTASRKAPFIRSWTTRKAPRGDCPLSFGSTLWSGESGLPDSRGNKGESKRSKHVPIEINYTHIQSVLRELPSVPHELPSECTSDLPTILGAGKPSNWQSGISKPRHVPIVIPDFAQPYGLYPQTPITPKTPIPESLPRKVFDCPLKKQAKFERVCPDKPDTKTPKPIDPDKPVLHHIRQLQGSTLKMNMASGPSDSGLHVQDPHIKDGTNGTQKAAGLPSQAASASPAIHQTNGPPAPAGPTNLSGLVCNVQKTTGHEPHSRVGATTTIVGDKLYAFGGRVLSRRPRLTSDVYELDLIRRHWTKLEVSGDVPAPRYFHSTCALGDTKLVCYGGMSPASPLQNPNSGPQAQNGTDAQPEVVVMSDIHIFDIPSRSWIRLSVSDAPQGRYAHCAAILPSTAVFTSASAPLSAIQHNPSSANPNHGTLGVSLDGTGGAEMIVVGGQDSNNHYIEEMSVFNFRSLTWTRTTSLGRSCGAYRSIVAPLYTLSPTEIGKGPRGSGTSNNSTSSNGNPLENGCSMLIYSNYNFLDVQLELQLRSPDGTLTPLKMQEQISPPGLRFPNGGVLDNHFVISGTHLTSSKQEYALWALDLKTLTWSRIEGGAGIFSQGSWNRGVLWSRRNTFVILGNRRRSLVDDYNHRRINFSHICTVELEAFGLYENPRASAPMSDYMSVSAPTMFRTEAIHHWSGGGRVHCAAAQELGNVTLGFRELADMDLLAIGGERTPVNSRVLARRWGPYFIQLLREGTVMNDGGDAATLRQASGQPSRNSSITITPSINTGYSGATTLTSKSQDSTLNDEPPDAQHLTPTSRPRTLYLPHTHQTIELLVHYLYTSALPPVTSPLCSPPVLCSILQIARPYQIDGLLEATVERLHQVLDGRNAAALFNAAAMAAGGGRGTGTGPTSTFQALKDAAALASESTENEDRGLVTKTRGLRINTKIKNTIKNVGRRGTNPDEESSSSAGTNGASSVSSSYMSSTDGEGHEVWSGEISSVVGLQKRGLRGLMEGKKMRERGRSQGAGAGPGAGTGPGAGSGAGGSSGAGVGSGVGVEAKVGLGIAQG